MEEAMIRRSLFLLLLFFVLAAGARAQEFRGAITGRVTDNSGAVLPGVTITVTNVATNVASTTVTNGEGLYTVPYLTPGNYKATAELSGFKKVERDGIEVRIGDRLAIDFRLEVGALEETVMVTARSPLLELGTASAGQVIDEKRISLMPLSDADFCVNRSGSAKPGLKYDRPGGSLGGPVQIPALYDGHDRTFFFGAAEWLYDTFPEPLSQTVPTDAMRNGDFSALLTQGITIYDPATAQQVGARVVRSPFPGNIIPANRINPVAAAVLKY